MSSIIPKMLRFSLGALWLGVTSMLGGCRSEPCPSGPSIPCTCPDGTASTQQCGPTGYEMCACDAVDASASADASLDASIPADASAGMDAALDAQPALEAGMDAGSSASAEIGPAGGSLRAGAIEVRIPAGAVVTAITVGIEPVTPSTAGAIGAAYELTPTGTTFLLPAAVLYHYDPASLAELDPSQLALATEVGGAWAPLEGAEVDPVAHVVSGETRHFSVFALVERGAHVDAGTPLDSGADAGWAARADLWIYRSDGITPLPGAEVCVMEHPEIACQTTDATGNTQVEIPHDMAFVIEVTRAGFLPLAIPSDIRGESGGPHLAGLVMLTTGEASLLAAAIGATLDPAAGFVYFGVTSRWDTFVPGITATLSGGVGEGPTYFQYRDRPDGTREIIPSTGVESGDPGSGFFHNVAPGMIEVTFGNGPSNPMCPFRKIPGWGWSTTDPTRHRAPVFMGHITVVKAWCA